MPLVFAMSAILRTTFWAWEASRPVVGSSARITWKEEELS